MPLRQLPDSDNLPALNPAYVRQRPALGLGQPIPRRAFCFSTVAYASGRSLDWRWRKPLVC